MKARILLSLILLCSLCGFAAAQGEDDSGMEVYVWNYPGCQHTMSTNFFELAPGAEVSLTLDLSACEEVDFGGLLFYGLSATKKNSKALTARSRVSLWIVEESTGNELGSSNDGSVLVDINKQTVVTLHAINMNRSKTLLIRLRS